MENSFVHCISYMYAKDIKLWGLEPAPPPPCPITKIRSHNSEINLAAAGTSAFSFRESLRLQKLQEKVGLLGFSSIKANNHRVDKYGCVIMTSKVALQLQQKTSLQSLHNSSTRGKTIKSMQKEEKLSMWLSASFLSILYDVEYSIWDKHIINPLKM